MYTIENQKFGIEIEFTGLSRSRALNILSAFFGNRATSEGVRDQQNRKWLIVRDGSVRAENGDQNELVSPPLKYEDMNTLQDLVRELREAGAIINDSCGIHVHIDSMPYDFRKVQNLIKYYSMYEDLFYKAANVLENRKRYAKPFNEFHSVLVEKVMNNRIRVESSLRRAFYIPGGAPTGKYAAARYTGLNLHNIFWKGWGIGTIEFRFFNSTLHAGEIRSYIHLCLALSTKALNTSFDRNAFNETLNYNNVLRDLGISEQQLSTKNVYKHLTKFMIDEIQQAS